jgi:hypothetical protein
MLFFLPLRWFILWSLVTTGIGSPQFNLYHTDRVSESSSRIVVQHNCLYAATTWMYRNQGPYQIIPYCLGKWPSEWKMEKNSCDKNFTFAELRTRHITSQQLYLWSAPIDLIEQYQFYLNQLTDVDETKLFCNCTWPWFGSMCQYMFDQLQPYHSSFAEMTHQFYGKTNEMTSLTCYTHLQCNHSIPSMCLDWTDICNGIIDCIDGGQDEKDCWQLEINDCQDNEYRCRNGQCIPKAFFHDDSRHQDCLDGTDEVLMYDQRDFCSRTEPAFVCEEIKCSMSNTDEREFRFLSSSSCVKERGKLLMESILSIEQNPIAETCWIPFLCVTHFQHQIDFTMCPRFCNNQPCQQMVEENCPDFIRLPAKSLFFGHAYLVYIKEALKYPSIIPSPKYVCYNEQLCNEMPITVILASLNNATCRPFNELPYNLTSHFIMWDTIAVHVQNLFRTCVSTVHNNSIFCNMPSMYQCLKSSKCISIYRLNDGIRDCYYGDDEQFIVTENNSLKPFKNCYKCKESNKCINHYFVNDGLHQCPLQDDEMWVSEVRISFQTICDGFTDLIPITINGRHETDETECEQWSCSNVYTRCNKIWNCLNGADELNCGLLPPSNCTSQQHLCVSPKTNEFMCLPVEKANDGVNDCLGATDEPLVCRTSQLQPTPFNFYCKNYYQNTCISRSSICTGNFDCIDGEDEHFCGPNDYEIYCEHIDFPKMSDLKKFFCGRLTDHLKTKFIVYFSLGQTNNSLTLKKNTVLPSPSMSQTTVQQHCHRGLNVRIRLGSEVNSTTTTCFCPPNYYGDTCQYQNQRVSLTLQIQTTSDLWYTQFTFVVLLIDNDERIVNSHEQFTYLSVRDCQTKFNIYLLYLTRPKNETKNYSIHIDTYETNSLDYRASWHLPLTFSFLSVHRISAQLIISRQKGADEICSSSQCVHGHCTKYANNNTISTTFCRCNQEWAGRFCNIPYTCTCAYGSRCVGVTANNQSLCVCSLGKFGPRCSLDNTVCQLGQNTTCLHGGQCIPVDGRIAFHKKFSCICAKGYSGDKCEIVDSKIVVSFEKDIILSQSMLVHFIQIFKTRNPVHETTFKKFYIGQDLTTIYWPHPFHIVFVEPLENIFYLIVVQKTYVQSTTLVRKIESSHRCVNISEIFNETFVNLHLIRRIKHYHEPCQRSSLQLSCFYDEKHFCLCTDFEQQRLANCFEFNFDTQHDCRGQSVCENGARCFPDNSTCPKTSMCVCTECFYGTRCQFTTQGFGLSLDAILGYHIRPHVNLRHQPLTVQMSMALVMTMLVLGLVNGILSVITFQIKKLREVGCGLYLFGSSITTLLIMTMLALKFWILVLSQMALITNPSFLSFQCISMDFLVRCCLNMDQWLSACVATERALTVIHGINFRKEISKRTAKWVIFALILLIISSLIHDPIHRRLINDDDEDEQRIWCVVSYSTKVEVFNSAVNIFHFLVPFSINVLSAIVIIVRSARQRERTRPRETYRERLGQQVQEHKRLLVAPYVLIILAFPRLYISFISSCMKSARDPWLYLVGYFMSFAPSMLTFVVFVLPSELYKKEFDKLIRRSRNVIRRRLYFES